MQQAFDYPFELPRLRTTLPGPKAMEVVRKDFELLSPSYTRDYPLVVNSAKGVGVEDVDGNWFLDFTAGIAVTNTGHNHPKVIAAIRNQTDKFLHMAGTDFYYESMVALGERLTKIAPGNGPKRVFFTNSGTEAVEGAIKLSRYATGRTRTVAFLGAFHGRSLGSLSISASKVQHRRGFSPFLADVHHAEFGNLASVEKLFKHTVPPEEVAAIFVEPVQGEGGYIVPPAEFLPGLRELCDQYGILLVADEIQSGMGRTGKMFASEHWHLVPDIICCAKGLASGMPLGAIIAKADVMRWQPGSHGSTFGGNPVACEAAIATIDILLNDGYLENAAQRGMELKQGLFEIAQQYNCIGEIRGLGLMLAVDIVSDSTKQVSPKLRNKIVEAAFQQGLLLLPCAEAAIRFSPPLCITSEHVHKALELFSLAIKKALPKFN